jgi:hypothetical protein
VFGGLLKLKEILQIKAGHLSRRLAKDCETRKIFCVVPALEVEGQKVTNVGLHEKGILARSYEVVKIICFSPRRTFLAVAPAAASGARVSPCLV